MVKIIENNNKTGIAVVSLNAGEIFYSSYIIPKEIEAFAEVEQSGSSKITAMKDILIVVEGLHQSKKGCKHMRFARELRRGKIHDWVEVKFWPRLRRALETAQIPTISAVGGFGLGRVYTDELAVPNFTMEGSSGWIILKKDIKRYLDALPPLEDSGEIISIWIETVGWVNTGECNISLHSNNPIKDDPIAYYDVGRGYSMSDNRQIVRVEYDKGSRMVEVGKRMPNFCVLRQFSYV